MRRYSAVSIGAVLMVIAGLFVCTIKDDTGSLVDPGHTPGGGTNPGIDSSMGYIYLFATAPTYVLVGDTARIVITVVKDSTFTPYSKPYANARVTVSTSDGWISNDTLTTDADGRAYLRFSESVERQNVVITISCRTAEHTVRIDVTDTPDQIQKFITAKAGRSEIHADAEDYTNIRVTVIDSNHNPVSGEAIQFVSTAGVISGLNPPAKGGNSGQSITDADGIAEAKLTSSNINDTAYVTVYLVGNMSMSDETQVAFLGVSIVARTDSSNLTKGSRTTITAQLLNASDNPIARAPIYFTRGKGTSSPLTFVDGSVDSVTGFDGVAHAIVEGTSNGTDSITIAAAGSRTNLRINVTSLLLSAQVSSPVLQANSGLADTLTVTFRDEKKIPLSGKVIRVISTYQTPKGDEVLDTLTGGTNVSGQCTFVFAALPFEARMRLEVTGYSSSTELASVESSIEFIATRNITSFALPAVIPADGTSKSQITVQVKNKDNNPIAGDEIAFTSSAGLVPSVGVTDENGRAVVSLISDRRNTTAVVIATLKKDPTVVDSVRVEFSGVELRASASPQSINSSGNDTSYVRITLQDAMKNPIVGERIFFRKQIAETQLIVVDSTTDNRGEGICKVVGTGTGQDTISVTASGASAYAVVYYSSNYLMIDTTAPSGTRHSYIANGRDTTVVTIRYREGNQTTPIPNALIEFSVTLGTLPGDSTRVFAGTKRTDASGIATFYLRNPDFANWTTMQAKAIVATEITTASLKVYYRADNIHHIDLLGTPEVISTNGGRAKITAVVYDAQLNRVKDANIAFNLINGPGGGEYLDPPTAISGSDGTATTYLVSGSLPSNFREVWIAAGDFSSLKSDTVKFTIAGPPAYITIRRQIGEIVKYATGTYGNKVSALVSDINGNPVADGTEVTFSAKVTGYCLFKKKVTWSWYYDNVYYRNGWPSYTVSLDSVLLPFEDLNDNYSGASPEPGEDRNRDGYANRGEDADGNGVYQTGPGFEDIDWNGYRNFEPEPSKQVIYYVRDTIVSALGDTTYPLREADTTIFADLNNNGRYDAVEPLIGDSTSESYWQSQPGYRANRSNRDPFLGGYPDIDWNNNGVPDPQTAILINRTVQTVGGVAANELRYGQSDALRIRVLITSEAQGQVTISPDEFILPLVKGDAPYWSPR